MPQDFQRPRQCLLSRMHGFADLDEWEKDASAEWGAQSGTVAFRKLRQEDQEFEGIARGICFPPPKGGVGVAE